MVTPTAIDLHDGQATTAAITVADGLVTVQASYTGLNGDAQITPLQTNNGSTWNPIYDYNDQPIIWHVPHKVKGGVESGSITFNIPDGLHTVSIKLNVAPTGGKFGATEGVFTLVVKNTDTEA